MHGGYEPYPQTNALAPSHRQRHHHCRRQPGSLKNYTFRALRQGHHLHIPTHLPCHILQPQLHLRLLLEHANDSRWCSFIYLFLQCTAPALPAPPFNFSWYGDRVPWLVDVVELIANKYAF